MSYRPNSIAGPFIATVSLFVAAGVFGYLGFLESRIGGSLSVTLAVAGALFFAALACAVWTAWRIVTALDFLVSAAPESTVTVGPETHASPRGTPNP